MVYLTAGAALEQGGFKPGMSELITTVGGGVGNAAYQLALLQGASTVIGTTGSPEKQERARKWVDDLFRQTAVAEMAKKAMPADMKSFEIHRAFRENIIDLSKESLEDRVREITKGKGVDFIVDTLGGDYFPRLIDLAAPNGTIASVGYKASLEAKINIMPILAKQLRILGTNVFNLAPEPTARIMRQVLDSIPRQQLHPLIDSVYPVEEAAKACEHQSQVGTFGKVVITFEH
jgi:NADPH2:quinone reductase